MLARHRENDALSVEPDLDAKATQLIVRLQADAAQLREWLAAHPEDRKGSKEEHKQELQRWMKMYVLGIMTNNGKYHFGGCPV